MSELEILRSEIEALKKEIQAQKNTIIALKEENKELKSNLEDELNRCADCHKYGGEKRYFHHRSGVILCHDCAEDDLIRERIRRDGH